MREKLGSASLFSIRILSSALGYLSLVLITNNISLPVLNDYTLITSMLTILYIIANFGFENVVLFLMTKYNDIKFYKFIKKCLILTSIVTITLGILLYYHMPWSYLSNINLSYLLFILSILFQTIMMLNRCAQLVHARYTLSIISENLIRPVFYIIGLSITIFVEGSLSLSSVAAAYFVSYFMGYLSSEKIFNVKYFSDSKFDYSESLNVNDIIKLSWDFFIIQLFNQLPNFLIVYIIGMLSSNVVGISAFRLSFQTVAMIGIALRSIESIYNPKLSIAYHDRNYKELENVYVEMRNMTLTAAYFLCMGAVILSPLLEFVFNGKVKDIKFYFIILCFQQFANAAFGSSDYLLMMTDNKKYVKLISILQTILCILLGVFLVIRYDVIGACITLIISTLFFKTTLSVISNKILKLNLFSFKYFMKLLIFTLTLVFVTVFYLY